MAILTLAFGVMSGAAWWNIIESAKHRTDKSAIGHYLLTQHLKFILPRTVSDIQATAFFRSEKAAPGGATCLLIFLENCASRQRRVTVTIARAPWLGLSEATVLNLTVLPGQAVVYRWPVGVGVDARPGEFMLQLDFAVSAPAGNGITLPSRSGKVPATGETITFSSRRLRVYATLAIGPGSPEHQPLASASYLALASPATPEPRFEILRQISVATPTTAIRLESTTDAPAPLLPG